MTDYDPKNIEAKWQAEWEKSGIYNAKDSGEKYYTLIEFPYPSGDGLHVGHVRSYTALDALSRKRRMEGKNVLYPIGWDAFGLPTENFAIKTGKDPRVVTKENSDTFRRQLKALGLSFDWSREVDTTDPKYYKWTQWIFLKFLENGLAYKARIPINWCPKDKIGLANEEVVDGKCERCGTPVEQREKEQWMLAITKYADRLYKDLETVDYPERVKTQQRNWIGPSQGAEIEFRIKNKESKIKIYTTRPDTIYGATFIVKAGKEDRFTGEYAINPATKEEIPIWEAEYVYSDYGTGAIMAVPAHDERDYAFAKKHNLPIRQVIMPSTLDEKSLPRADKKNTERNTVHVILRNPKDKTVLVEYLKGDEWGDNKPVCFVIGGIEEGESSEEAAKREIVEETGYTNFRFVEEIPLEVEAKFYAAHKDVNRKIHVHTLVFDLLDSTQKEISDDEKKLHDLKWLPEAEVGKVITIPDDKLTWKYLYEGSYAFEEQGVLINSGEFNKISSEEAKQKITDSLGGKWVIKYKLRDWVFSRQRYWGEPIPVVHCEKCGIVPVPEKDLPVLLPEVENYQPTETGDSPLANISDWVNIKCPKCGGEAKRETDVMPNWAGSSWYFLRYTDPHNDGAFAGAEALKNWMPIDWYNGGMEHTTLHLLYSRFWNKFLFDLGLVPTSEPYKKRTSHGLILAEGGVKMSKSKGNVVNPDEIVRAFGADTLRLYEMFMGPFEQAISWDEKALVGPRRFIERVWKLKDRVKESDFEPSALLNQTIKKVSEDIETLGFNTAVSTLMIYLNELEKNPTREEYKVLLKLLAPFAPHITEELWHGLGHTTSIHLEAWPTYDESKLKSEKQTLAVQVNGKVRATLETHPGESEEEVKSRALALPEVAKWLDGKAPSKVIVVPQKIVSIVI